MNMAKKEEKEKVGTIVLSKEMVDRIKPVRQHPRGSLKKKNNNIQFIFYGSIIRN